ncbi:hypothetical protein SAMN04488556_1692 [Halostagnicola kamekurae]|uniref:Uncharacterized protein n=1 Tax=Halostagnicola kamekurae TaxID=619731 RepID=A0A1I6QYC7_9EURY|nr:hypothetical protein SAMN04488556_1692 [Halostagnicola kamekurae]
MDKRYSWVLGIVLGVLFGYLFGVRSGGLVIGSCITLMWSIAGYGIFAYPQYRTRWSAPDGYSRFWYSLSGLGAVPVMIFAPFSPLIPYDPSVVLLLGSIWAGGVFAGVALVRESPVAEKSR